MHSIPFSHPAVSLLLQDPDSGTSFGQYRYSLCPFSIASGGDKSLPRSLVPLSGEAMTCQLAGFLYHMFGQHIHVSEPWEAVKHLLRFYHMLMNANPSAVVRSGVAYLTL